MSDPIITIQVFLLTNAGILYEKSLDSGEDPGFPVGGGANSTGTGRQHMISSKFPKNCMKLRTFWAVGGGLRVGGAPPPASEICKFLYNLAAVDLGFAGGANPSPQIQKLHENKN